MYGFVKLTFHHTLSDWEEEKERIKRNRKFLTPNNFTQEEYGVRQLKNLPKLKVFSYYTYEPDG